MNTEMEGSTQSKDDLISGFCDITGVETERAQFYLESTNWNLQLAIQSFFDHSAEDSTVPRNTNEEQQRQQQIQQMIANPPMATQDSSEDSSSPKNTKKPKDVPKGQTNQKFATIGSLKQNDSNSSDEEEGQAFYTGGSQHSGQQVLGPKKKKNTDELVSQMFASAKEHGAQVVDPSQQPNTQKRNTFGGTGFKLGSTAEPSTAMPSSSTERPQDIEVTLRFWRNGFTLDDGPLRDFNDPQNKEFLQSIQKGEIPRELIQKYKGREVHVNMEDKKEEYVPPKRQLKAFSGEGHRLGNPTAEVVSSAQTNADTKVSEAEALKTLNFNESQPSTNIQIRLSDGSRLVVRMNMSHTVGDIRQFICNSRPVYLTQTFKLLTTFPNRELNDDKKTISEANLSNAVIIQKLH